MVYYHMLSSFCEVLIFVFFAKCRVKVTLLHTYITLSQVTSHIDGRQTRLKLGLVSQAGLSIPQGQLLSVLRVPILKAISLWNGKGLACVTKLGREDKTKVFVTNPNHSTTSNFE